MSILYCTHLHFYEYEINEILNFIGLGSNTDPRTLQYLIFVNCSHFVYYSTKAVRRICINNIIVFLFFIVTTNENQSKCKLKFRNRQIHAIITNEQN